MTKSISHIIWHSLSQAVVHAINCDDEDCSALTETIHADTLKELEAIISEQVIGDYRKVGLPTTQKAEQSNYNNKILNQHIGDQRRRLQVALYGKEAEL